jgi:hypothetical protein
MEDGEFQLERDKLAFEVEKFQSEAGKRTEEVEKLRAERQKIELEMEDLRVPYKKRPAYKTAVFQGVALVMAVLSALISVGSYKLVFDAYNATKERDAARAEADAIRKDITAASLARDLAVRDKGQAQTDLLTAKGDVLEAKSQLGTLKDEVTTQNRQLAASRDDLAIIKLQEDEARKDAAVAPVKEMLSSLNEKPDDEVQRKHLLDTLSSSDPEETHPLRNYVQGFALDESRSVKARLVALQILYKQAATQRPARYQEMADYRHQYIVIALSSNEGTPKFGELVGFLGSHLAAQYICGAYDSMAWVDSRYDANRWPWLNYIGGAFYTEPECLHALWDSKDPRLTGRIHSCFIASFETFISSCYKPGSTITKKNVFWHFYLYDGKEEVREEFLIAGPETLMSIYEPGLSEAEITANVNKWMQDNPQLVRTFSEPGLPKLRTCTFRLWNLLMHEHYIGTAELSQYCVSDGSIR